MDCPTRLGKTHTPVHTFVVRDDPKAVSDFERIAKLSGGHAGKLDGSREMIDLAVMAILSRLTGVSGVTNYAAGRQLSHNAERFKQQLLGGPQEK